MSDENTSSIRPATTDDLQSLVEIEKKVHLASAAWTFSHFEAELKKPHSRVWVLTDDETDSDIMGYVVFWILGGDCEILNVAVPLPHRGHGYAKRLIGKVVQEALQQGCKKINLEVRKSNLPAIQLYQGVGFSIHSIRKGFYSNSSDGGPEDAYHMELLLEPTGADILPF